MRPTEAECQSTIVDAARRFGWLVHHTRPARMESGRWATPLQGHKGFPDLVLARRGQVLFVELKRKPNKVEPDQEAWLEALAGAGLDVRLLWVPEQMDAFIKEVLR